MAEQFSRRVDERWWPLGGELGKIFAWPLSVGKKELEANAPWTEVTVDISHFNGLEYTEGGLLVIVVTPDNPRLKSPGRNYDGHGHFVPHITVKLNEAPIRRTVLLVNGPVWERFFVPADDNPSNSYMEEPIDNMRGRTLTSVSAEAYKVWTLLEAVPYADVSEDHDFYMRHTLVGERKLLPPDEEHVRLLPDNTLPESYQNARQDRVKVHFSMAWPKNIEACANVPKDAHPAIDHIIQSQRAITTWKADTMYYIWIVTPTKTRIRFFNFRVYDNVRIFNFPLKNVHLLNISSCGQSLDDTSYKKVKEVMKSALPKVKTVTERPTSIVINKVRSRGHVFWMDVMQKDDAGNQGATRPSIREWQPYTLHEQFGSGPRARPESAFEAREKHEPTTIHAEWEGGKIMQLETGVLNGTESRFNKDNGIAEDFTSYLHHPGVNLTSYLVRMEIEDFEEPRRLFEYDFGGYQGFKEALQADHQYKIPGLAEKYVAHVQTSNSNQNILRTARALAENRQKIIFPTSYVEVATYKKNSYNPDLDEEEERTGKAHAFTTVEDLHVFFFVDFHPRPGKEVFVGIRNLPPNVICVHVSPRTFPEAFSASALGKLPTRLELEKLPAGTDQLKYDTDIFEMPEETRHQIRHRYFFGVARANRSCYIGNESLPLPVPENEVYNVLIIRSEHQRQPPNTHTAPLYDATQEPLEKLNVSECDTRAYAQKNRRMINDWKELYTSYSLMHFWRFRGVALFDLAKGYPADTTYLPDMASYRKLGHGPAPVSMSLDVLEKMRVPAVQKQKLSKAFLAYGATYPNEKRPSSAALRKRRRNLRPVTRDILVWAFDHGAACDCDDCQLLYDNDEISRDGCMIEQESKILRVERFHEHITDPLQQNREMYIDALELGLRDADVILNQHDPTTDPHHVQSMQQFVGKRLLLNRMERKYWTDHNVGPNGPVPQGRGHGGYNPGGGGGHGGGGPWWGEGRGRGYY